MANQHKTEISITYIENATGEVKTSYVENYDVETALRRFLMMKGGKRKISITQIQEWDRRKDDNPLPEDETIISVEDKDGIVYKVMNE